MANLYAVFARRDGNGRPQSLPQHPRHLRGVTATGTQPPTSAVALWRRGGNGGPSGKDSVKGVSAIDQCDIGTGTGIGIGIADMATLEEREASPHFISVSKRRHGNASS